MKKEEVIAILGLLLVILSFFTSEVRCFLGLVSESCPKTEETIKNIPNNNLEPRSDAIKSSNNSSDELRDSENDSSQWSEIDHIEKLDDIKMVVNFFEEDEDNERNKLNIPPKRNLLDTSAKWLVIVGSFKNCSTARRHSKDLLRKGIISEIILSKNYEKLTPGYCINIAGAFSSVSSARKLSKELKGKKIDNYVKNSGKLN